MELVAGAPSAFADVHREDVVSTRVHELRDELVGPNLLGKRGGVDAQQRARYWQRRSRTPQCNGGHDGGYEPSV